MSIKGVRRLMEKSILNYHFDYWNTSLMIIHDSICFTQQNENHKKSPTWG